MGSKYKLTYAAIGAFHVGVFLAVIYGYFNNILEFVQSAETLSQSNLLIARLVGIFLAPVGVVLGFV